MAAVEAVDAATDGYPVYFMINCAHPDHFAAVLDDPLPGHSGFVVYAPMPRVAATRRWMP